MENTNTQGTQVPAFDEEVIYTVVRNKTANQKVVLATLGMEIAPGQSVNLKAMFRKAQLVDAAQEIYHFINYGALEDLSGNKSGAAPAQSHNDFQAEMKKRVEAAKLRELMSEINGSSTLTRLEDILTDAKTPEEAKKAAKLRYMQLRGWVDDQNVLIEGSMDDDQKDIVSIDSWEFKPFRVNDQTSVIQ